MGQAEKRFIEIKNRLKVVFLRKYPDSVLYVHRDTNILYIEYKKSTKEIWCNEYGFWEVISSYSVRPAEVDLLMKQLIEKTLKLNISNIEFDRRNINMERAREDDEIYANSFRYKFSKFIKNLFK